MPESTYKNDNKYSKNTNNHSIKYKESEFEGIIGELVLHRRGTSTLLGEKNEKREIHHRRSVERIGPFTLSLREEHEGPER
ncbi:hypothetical protein BDV37DRAFT_240738 [Aspergillus pseudonomiae]|uniref:Uncharacterized protein n=1 Tax=Aspergillus pseudonomiae TaxID=1506151 RepID=A0A5N7DMK6_9EURO|nr:uncharacterized protein BDV37DRAFT_240738 [Aspergillus pseudonomiae]KAE8407672.1 hypothetical protein BDV37DRAFT_240738 [Aspergillus pseudonomiae]